MVGRLILPVGYPDPAKEVRAAVRMAELRHEGWQTTVYTPDVPSVDAPLRSAGIDLRHLPFRGLTDYSTICHLSRHLEREAAGAVVVAQSVRIAFVVLCARKLAYRPDIRVMLVDSTLRSPRTSFIYRRVYRNLSAIIFTSRYGLELFRSTGARIGKELAREERLHVVYEGVGAVPMSREEPRGPIVALYNGELRAGSGLESVIDSLEELRGKRIRLMISGRGNSDYMDRLRRRAIRRGVMDLISWRRERLSMEELGGQCHFGIFPYEGVGFSDSNVEVMAAGRPQIVTDNRVAREYLGDDGGAVYVRSGDTASLMEAVLRLGGDASVRNALGMQAVSRYKSRLNMINNTAVIGSILTSV